MSQRRIDASARAKLPTVANATRSITVRRTRRIPRPSHTTTTAIGVAARKSPVVAPDRRAHASQTLRYRLRCARFARGTRLYRRRLSHSSTAQQEPQSYDTPNDSLFHTSLPTRTSRDRQSLGHPPLRRAPMLASHHDIGLFVPNARRRHERHEWTKKSTRPVFCALSRLALTHGHLACLPCARSAN
jgi:hypothetical protein